MIRVTRDLFGIADRLKRVNKQYEVYYNNQKREFEIRVGQNVEFTFGTLDCRVIEKAYKTRIENLDNIMREIDRGNKLAEGKTQTHIEKLKADLAEVLRFANRTGQDVACTKTNIKEY